MRKMHFTAIGSAQKILIRRGARGPATLDMEEKNAALKKEVTELRALVNALAAKVNGGGL